MLQLCASTEAAAPAIFDTADGRLLTYGTLVHESIKRAQHLASDRKGLAFCMCGNRAESVVDYLACSHAGHAVALLDRKLSGELLEGLLTAYRPEWILGADQRPNASYDGRPGLWRRTSPAADGGIHADLGLLLATSGTTGSPKFVRLTTSNVCANARSIVEYLGLQSSDRPMLALPMHYSYGLSVLNSHFLAGACITLSEDGLMAPGFWSAFRQRQCTSLAGVPYTFSILSRLGFLRKPPPTLRTMTQAGGRMSPELIEQFHAGLTSTGARLWVMYGQTEATARIAYLPPSELPGRANSIGIAIPGGQLSIERDGDLVSEPGVEGELRYRGPNVMLGYAVERSELALGDVTGGSILTGDLGYRDADGFYYITGRTRRIAKVFGFRVSLDEVESRLHGLGTVAAISDDSRIVVFVERGDASVFDATAAALAAEFRINVNAFDVRGIESLPRLASGKVDYGSLRA